MEGSGKANTGTSVDPSDPAIIFGNAGLPRKDGAAWMKAPLRFGRNLQRDSAAATKYWRSGSALLAKLPGKPKRTGAQQRAADIILAHCRHAREQFLTHHADAIYR